jgi:hypothetical protein
VQHSDELHERASRIIRSITDRPSLLAAQQGLCFFRRLGVLDKVKFFTGDFRNHEPIVSNVLFCDCLHDEYEIKENAAALVPWLRTGSILACHDLGRIPDLIYKFLQR